MVSRCFSDAEPADIGQRHLKRCRPPCPSNLLGHFCLEGQLKCNLFGILSTSHWVAVATIALAELGLIDEYEFVVHPRLAGHGPTLFAGLTKYVDLTMVDLRKFGSGAVAMRYVPR